MEEVDMANKFKKDDMATCKCPGPYFNQVGVIITPLGDGNAYKVKMPNGHDVLCDEWQMKGLIDHELAKKQTNCSLAIFGG
jgi:hypothetical protein